jgi:hypothetical protein
MVRAQMLSELEEIIAFKQYADQPERQMTMKKTWLKRFVYASYRGLMALKFAQVARVSAGR